MVKYFKIVYGYNEGDYLPITSDELHKAQLVAIQGGSANFEAGFFNNRGNDIMRIVPDWHRVRGWNRSHKMDEFDFQDIRPLEESYKKTLDNSKKLIEFIIDNKRFDLLKKPASEAFVEIKELLPQNKFTELNEGATNLLTNKFKIN